MESEKEKELKAKWAKEDVQRDEHHAAVMAELKSSTESRSRMDAQEERRFEAYKQELQNVQEHRKNMEKHWERIAHALKRLAERS